MGSKGINIRATARTEGVTQPLAKLQQQLLKSRKSADKLAERFELAGKASKVLGGALERVGQRLTDFAIQAPAAMLAFGKGMIDATRHAENLAKATGSSTQGIQALLAAGGRLRIEADNTGEAIKTFQENLGELARIGTGPAKDSLGSLGLTLEDFAGLDIEDRLGVFSDALRGMEDPTKQLSVAIEIMGEDGAKLLPLLQKGSKGIDQLTAAARKSGQVLDDDAIASMRELDRTAADVEAQFQGVANEVLIELLPAAKDMAKGMQEWVAENDDFIKQDIPAVFGAVGSAVGIAAEGVKNLTSNMRALIRVGDRLGDSLADFAGAGDQGPRHNERHGFHAGQSEADGTAARIAEEGRAAARANANAIFDEEMANVERANRRARATRFEAGEKGQLGKGRKRDGRSAFEKSLGLGKGSEGRFDTLAARGAEGDTALDDLFGFHGQIAEPDFAGGLDALRAFEESKSQLVFDERMRGIEMLRAAEADPVMLIEAEEQARVQFLDNQLSRAQTEIEQEQLKNQIEETHHRARLQRMAQEDKARKTQGALIKSYTDLAIDSSTAVATAAINAAVSGEGGVRQAVHGFARSKAIEMGILALSETAKGVAALASPLTIPFAAGHFAAAGKAGAAGLAMGAIAGVSAGGVSAGAGGGGGASVGTTRGTSGQQGFRGGAPPISRPGASAAVQASTGGARRSQTGGNSYHFQFSGIGFAGKDEIVAEVRRSIQRSEQDVGGI